ncbi:MAG: hypothetical protein R3D34_08780 [Nitratireductor sp.]
MARYLAVPLVALLAGAVSGYALHSFGGALLKTTLLEAVLAGAVIACLLMVVAANLVFARYWHVASRLQKGMGIYEADITRRLAALEIAVGNLAQTAQQLGERQPLVSAENAATNLRASAVERGYGDDTEFLASSGQGDAGSQSAPANNVIRFDPASRGREAGETQHGETNVPAIATPTGSSARKIRLTQQRLADALEKGQVDAWFQPVVTLPGRKTRLLEAVPHVEGAQPSGGRTTGSKAEAGERNGSRQVSGQLQGYSSHAGQIDHLMLVRASTLARRLDREDRGCTLLWRMDLATIRDAASFDACKVTLKGAAPGPRLIKPLIEWRHLRSLDDAGVARLHSLAEDGYRLAIANCPNPQQMAQAMESGLFDLVMIDAELLTSESEAWRDGVTRLETGRQAGGRTGAAVPPRLGIEIVATNVDTEMQVMALIDNDILLAQGGLFSAPKRLRDDGPSAAKA